MDSAIGKTKEGTLSCFEEYVKTLPADNTITKVLTAIRHLKDIYTPFMPLKDIPDDNFSKLRNVGEKTSEKIAELKTKYLSTVYTKEQDEIMDENKGSRNDWAQEKVENLLKSVILALNLIDENEIRADEFKDGDLKHNIRGVFESMTYDLTKLYAFFSNREWDVDDRKYIVEERKEGLDKIKNKYNK